MQDNSFLPIELVENTKPTRTIPEIHEAINTNNLDKFTSLISPETINQKDSDGVTPLMVACIKESFTIVSILCEQGANIDDKCTKRGYTAFMYSCFGRDLEIIKFLISKNCNISTIDISGDDICSLGLWSPILSLIEKSTPSTNEFVKCRQCDTNFKNVNGWSPDGAICKECQGSDIFGESKPKISASELKKINRMGGGSKSSSPVFNKPSSPIGNKSPTNIQQKSTSYYNCPDCKNLVEISARNCNCGRKSPFAR